MDDDSKPPLPGTDGWIDPYAATEFGLPAVSDEEPVAQPRPAPSPTAAIAPAPASTPVRAKDPVDEGKPMALLSHASVLLGMPLFIIPMMQKDNAFALHHSKAAAVNYIFFIVAVSVTVFTCGLGFPLIFLVYIPMLLGFINAVNGQRAGSWAWGKTGEKMFHGLQVDDAKQLEDQRW